MSWSTKCRPSSGRRFFRGSVQEEVEAIFTGLLEAQTEVKAEGGVLALDVDGENFSCGGSFGDEAGQNLGADTLPAMPCEKGQIHDADFLVPAVHINAAYGFSAGFDEEEFRRGIVFPVMEILSAVLHGAKTRFFSFGPRGERQLILPGGGVDFQEQGGVARAGRAQAEIRTWHGIDRALETGQTR